ALSKGAIGDAFAEIGQMDEAYEYYVLAFQASQNSFTTPKYLFKAAMIADLNNQKKIALSYFKRIKKDYPKATESQLVDVQIGRLENIN
ncbi:MAG: hypothetical protein CMC57_05285, partial [Flavobacteriaceae bacterium]|nr:hypothetical protein [Flavobacteriaceae bacterium]